MAPQASAFTAATEKRRKDILDNALLVFAREGFHRADVQVIADLSGVGKGTVYRHFGNKEELFLAVGRFCVEQLGEFIRQAVGDEREIERLVAQQGSGALLRRIAIAFAEYYEKTPQAIEITIQERAEFRESVFPTHLMHRAETRGGLDEFVAAAIKGGEFRRLDAQAVTDALADLLFGTVVNGCLGGGRAKLVERVDVAMDVLIHGILNADAKPSASPRRAN